MRQAPEIGCTRGRRFRFLLNEEQVLKPCLAAEQENGRPAPRVTKRIDTNDPRSEDRANNEVENTGSRPE